VSNEASELAKRDWDAAPPKDVGELVQMFDEWLECTGCISQGSSYYWELRSFFTDDVRKLLASRVARLEGELAKLKADSNLLRPRYVILQRAPYRYVFAECRPDDGRGWPIYEILTRELDMHFAPELGAVVVPLEGLEP